MSSNPDEDKDGVSLMVKFNSTQDDGREGCFICAASNPKWHVFAKPQNNSVKTPFFPFLEYHERSTNARPMDNDRGKVDVCAVCFSFLTQQWRAFEEKETPLVKRIYWLKRPGHEEGFDREDERGCGAIYRGDNSEVMEQCQHSKVKSPKDQDAGEPVESLTILKDYKDSLTNDPCASNDDLEATATTDIKKETILELCFVCSRQKPKEFMRSVHTRPQLKTETPFYPCLAKHNPTLYAKKVDFLGKVLVCEACQKFLFRQWQVFQKNNTPLIERQYQLRSDPSLPRDQQSQLSTMVCFICGVSQPATSGRFLYSSKQSSGDPYFPFLNKLAPPPGAMPLTKQGLTRACSGCRKSLHRQWKEFEATGLPEDQREYRIRNEAVSLLGKVATLSSPSFLIHHNAAQESSPHKFTPTGLKCYTCSESCDESFMRPIYTRENTNPLKDSFYFPYIALLKPSAGSRKIDPIGRTLVCKSCYKTLQIKWEHYEREMVPQHRRIYNMDNKANVPHKSQSYVCFLCGTKCNSIMMNFKLHSFPHNGEGVQDGGSFFPFLASREPKPNAQPISHEGTVLTCEICFNNLMVQWNDFENSNNPEESNRWLRKYRIDHVICYSCGQYTSRPDCHTISKHVVKQKYSSYIPPQSVVANKKQHAVVCGHCYRKAVNNNITLNNEQRLSTANAVHNPE